MTFQRDLDGVPYDDFEREVLRLAIAANLRHATDPDRHGHQLTPEQAKRANRPSRRHFHHQPASRLGKAQPDRRPAAVALRQLRGAS